MNKIFIIIFVFISLCLTITSCKSSTSNSIQSDIDSVSFKQYDISDSLKFDIANEGNGIVKINTLINLPFFYSDSIKTKQLLALFSSSVLNIDSIGDSNNEAIVRKSIKVYASRFGTPSKEYFKEPGNAEEYCLMDETIRFITKIHIYPVFNQDGILTICKERITKNNNEHSMDEHQYFNFDLNKMELIELNDIFRDEAVSEINSKLKMKLMNQLNVASEDALNDLGYFNLDNLNANNNFLITTEGLQWTFLPLEIGCFNVGETKISLNYSQLSPLFSDERNIFSQYITKE